jgi:hypothetical protein
MLFCKIGIDGVEFAHIGVTQIGWRPQAEQHRRDAAPVQFGEDRVEIRARLRRGETAQEVVAAQLDDDEIGRRLGDRGGDALAPARGRLARDAAIHHLDIGVEFLLRQLQPPALLIGARRFLPLFHQLAEDGQDVFLGDQPFGPVRPVGNLAVLDGGVDQPQRGQPVGLSGLHRFFQRALQAVTKGHRIASPWFRPCYHTATHRDRQST